MKAFTDLEQSKTLAEFLPLESADMFWLVLGNTPRVHVLTEPLSNYSQWESYPCWSLAALLDVLPGVSLNTFKDGNWNAMIQHDSRMIYEDRDNPVDACYELILKLHELKML